MGGKKGKALAVELMDDLLGDDAGDNSATEIEAKTKVKANREEESVDFDFSHSVISVDPTVVRPPRAAAVVRPSDHIDPSPPEIDLGQTAISDVEKGPDSSPPPIAATEDDRTIRLGNTVPTPPLKRTPVPPEDRVRASVGRFGAFRSSGPVGATEAALAQSENLRIAQGRLTEFEQEIERLRLQNEELAAVGETLRRRTDELLAANQKRETDYQNAVSTFRQEKEILTNSKEAVQQELEAARQRNDELELRISTNIQKIRVRERELENRLELVKMESAALIRSKDEMILELKRQIDQLNMELNNYRNKNQELNRLGSSKQEMLHRTVKALRLALSMLEGEEEAPRAAQRKAK